VCLHYLFGFLWKPFAWKHICSCCFSSVTTWDNHPVAVVFTRMPLWDMPIWGAILWIWGGVDVVLVTWKTCLQAGGFWSLKYL
jgi:hypothetical protein